MTMSTGEDDRAELIELYAFRLGLERATAREAALRRAELRPFVKAWQAQADSARLRGDLDRLVELDVSFHRAIAEAAGNRYLLAALDANLEPLERAMRRYLASTTFRDDVWDEHVEIAAAIAAGLPELAETLLAAHVQESRDVALSLGPALSDAVR